MSTTWKSQKVTRYRRRLPASGRRAPKSDDPYLSGILARAAGFARKDNPYLRLDDRVTWYRGFIESDTRGAAEAMPPAIPHKHPSGCMPGRNSKQETP